MDRPFNYGKLAQDSYFTNRNKEMKWLEMQISRTATENNFSMAIEELLDQYTILYQKEVDMLTNYQFNFLKALCNNETSFGSTAVLQGYNLGTSANITRLKTALQNHEIIDVLGKQITLNDPLFEIWLKKRFLRMTFDNDQVL